MKIVKYKIIAVEEEIPSTLENFKKWEFTSSPTIQLDFKIFAKEFKKFIEKNLPSGSNLIKFYIGHYYLYGFIKKNDKYVYFSIPDVRNFRNHWINNILIRTASSEEDFTGGVDGMSVDSFVVFGFEFVESIHWYILVAVLLVFFIWTFENLINSPFGRLLRSIHDSEKAANSVGVDVSHYKSIVFVLSVVIATIAGSLYAFFSGFISPAEASFTHSIELVVMVVLGGLGRVYGAIIGAVVLTVLPQLLTAFEEYETLVFGSIIILVMIFMPKGIASLWDKIVDKKESTLATSK